MALWRLLDAEHEKLRFANPVLDLGLRAALIVGFVSFLAALFMRDDRLLLYPCLIFIPALSALLFDAAWLWGMAMVTAVCGTGAAVVEGLFRRDVPASLTAFVFSWMCPWLAAGLDRMIRRVEDARVMGRVAVREAEEHLTGLERLTIPKLRHQIRQHEMRLAKYDRLNRLLLDVPEGRGLQAVAEFYVKEAENLIGRGHGEFYIESSEDGVRFTAISVHAAGRCRIVEGDPEDALYTELMQHARPALSENRSEIFVPVVSEDRPIGILRISARQGELAEPDLRLLDGLAILASVSVMNALLYRRMERLAQTDGLTGISKRTVFDEALVEEIIRSRRYGARLAVILFDIDHFRNFNTKYGHLTGDHVIRETARFLREAMPPYATVARWGGEEFVVLLPNEDAVKAAWRADQLRDTIAEQLRIPADVSSAAVDERITFSAGVSQFPDHSVKPDLLLQCADEALYRAKQSGRNQVAIYSQGSSRMSPSETGA